MGIVRKIANAPREGYRFFKLYGQHLPQAFDAIFALPCSVTKLQGRLRGSEEEITIAYIGRRRNYDYLLRAIFDEYREIENKTSNLLAFRKHLDRMTESSDVVVVDVGWPYSGLFSRKGGYLEVPDWVNMAIEFPGDWDEVVRNFRRTARKHDLRLIRRNGYRCEPASTREAVEKFYDEMYIPFVRHRHADESVIAPRNHVIKRGMQGTLLHILRSDEIVAAGIIYPEDDVMFSLWMGLPRRYLESQPEAAISALYFFGIRYAFDKGYKVFDFTGTRAFLNDGAYQFKRRWGPQLDDAFSPGSILIRPQNGNRKAALFCQQVPVLNRTAAGLEALFLRVDGPVDEDTFARLEKDFGCGGFASMTVIEISDENETRSILSGDGKCEYRLIKSRLESFGDRYVRRQIEHRSPHVPKRPLIDWPHEQPLQDQVVRAGHHLLDTGLFSDGNLIELFDRHDPDELLVYRMGDDHHNLDDFQYGSRGNLTATQLLDAVKAGKLWLNIINMTTNDERFDQLVDGIYDELEEKVPGFRTVYRSANLLISSPGAKVYYHADAPLNMLWHLRGEKRVWVYPGDERFAPREWVEMIFTRESDDDLPYKPDFDQYATAYDLSPGEMLTWPQNRPHRVENVSGLNVSLTTEHYTPEAMKKRMTYLSNRYLRKWFRLPTTDVSLNGPRASMKRTLFRLARRLPGLNEAREYDDPSKFSLDG